jgi:RHS repeat-associated protein
MAGFRLLAQVDADGAVSLLPQRRELGSTLALTDGAGAVTDQFAYSPYGQLLSRTGTNSAAFQWLGGYGVYFDSATDLHLTLHRAYSADQRRFISTDPMGVDGGANLYAYGDLNPLFFVDPMGLFTFQIGVSSTGGGGVGGTSGYGIAISYSKENGLQAGSYGTAGGGSFVGAGGSGSIDVTWSGNKSINDLNGTAAVYGGSGTLFGISAGGEMTDPMDGNLKSSWTGSVGASIPGSTLGDGHVFYTITSVNQWGGNKTSSPCK